MLIRNKKINILILLVIALGAGGLVIFFLVRSPKTPAPQTPVSENATSTPTSTPEQSSTTASWQQPKPNQAPAKPKPQVITPSASTKNIEVMAWIYPGNPTCSAPQEYSREKIDILKPEYFMVTESGELKLLTEDAGCNGYSTQNVADIKKHSKEQYVTVSSSYSGSMDTFLTQALADDSYVNTLTKFVVDNGMTGIEIDFEDFGGWNGDMYTKYKEFVTKLGNSLHAQNKKLMVDGPATSNSIEEGWFVWRYSDFTNLPVDRMVIMAYDYQYDQGVGEPISPLSWIQGVIKWTLASYPYKNKISVGIPSYGYKGQVGTQHFSLLTYNQIKNEPGFSTATVDGNSGEMTWKDGNYVYFYQTSSSLDKKLQAVRNSGITSVSVWHLGGNLWFD